MTLGIALSPAGEAVGAQTIENANKLVSEIAADYDEVQSHVVRGTSEQGGDPAFVQMLYVFVRHGDEAPAVRSKKE